MKEYKDLAIGNIINIPYYDSENCVVVELDLIDYTQPVRVEWEDGSYTWAETKYFFNYISDN